MPRIAVISSHPPFAQGGHLTIARNLVTALATAGHEAELILTPQNRFGRQGSAYLATWLTDVGESDGRRIDQVITLRYPSYAVRHPRQVAWLNHTMREYYDLWPAFRARLSSGNRVKEETRRRLVRAADRWLLRPGRLTRLYVQSHTVKTRLRDALGLEAEVLYPPPPVRSYRCETYDDYVFAVSRLTSHKRLDLLVRALADPQARGVKAVIAGEGPEGASLRTLADQLGVSTRITFAGALDEATLLDHYARCRAVCFTPFGEDYGFVTVEAFASGKPVISCHDSGGPAELVTPERTGLLCVPEPASIAAALARLIGDRAFAERLGAEARSFAAGLRWPDVVDRLVVV